MRTQLANSKKQLQGQLTMSKFFKFHITFPPYSFWTYRPTIPLPKNIAHCPNPKEKQPRCDLCMDIHSAKPYPTWKFPNISISSSSLPLFNIIFPFYFSTTAKRCQTQKKSNNPKNRVLAPFCRGHPHTIMVSFSQDTEMSKDATNKW